MDSSLSQCAQRTDERKLPGNLSVAKLPGARLSELEAQVL